MIPALIASFAVAALLVVLYLKGRSSRSSQDASARQTKAEKLDTTLRSFATCARYFVLSNTRELPPDGILEAESSRPGRRLNVGPRLKSLLYGTLACVSNDASFRHPSFDTAYASWAHFVSTEG